MGEQEVNLCITFGWVHFKANECVVTEVHIWYEQLVQLESACWVQAGSKVLCMSRIFTLRVLVGTSRITGA